MSSRPGSRNAAGLHRHRFAAPLPSLPSESLMMGDDDDDAHNTYDNRRAGRSLADIPDLPPPRSDRRHRRGDGAAFAGEEADAGVLHALIAEMPDAPLEPPPAVSVFESWSTDDEKKASSAATAAGAARRAFRKRRHSARPASPGKTAVAAAGGSETSHKRNGSGDVDAGAGASPRHKKLRTPARRDRERERGGEVVDERMPDAPPATARPRSAQSGLRQMQSVSSMKALEVLGMSSAALPPPPPEPLLPPPPPPTLSPPQLQPAPRAPAGLETVLEELNPHHHQNQQQKPPRGLKPILRPSPSMPASLAAASPPGAGSARARNVLHKHSRSMSPVKSPRREPRAGERGDGAPAAAELAARDYRSRSVSPPPAPAPESSPQRAERRRLRRRQEEAVTVWPDGVEVPPLPGRGVEQQQVGTFEWPEDVF